MIGKTADKRPLAKKWVQCLIEHSASYQLLCWFDNVVLRNPSLRKLTKFLQTKLTGL